jgi:subtilase family serine protease
MNSSVTNTNCSATRNIIIIINCYSQYFQKQITIVDSSHPHDLINESTFTFQDLRVPSSIPVSFFAKAIIHVCTQKLFVTQIHPTPVIPPEPCFCVTRRTVRTTFNEVFSCHFYLQQNTPTLLHVTYRRLYRISLHN